MDKAVAQYFPAMVEKYPDQLALFIDGNSYTYKELNVYVEGVLSIIQLKLKLEQAVIGISGEHTIWAYAAILAISLSGNTILPINPSLPVERNVNLINMAAPALILSNFAGTYETKIQQHPLLKFPHHWYCFESSSFCYGTNKTTSKGAYLNYAYILFTSGSTGKPKGVPIKNCHLNHLLKYYLSQEHYDFNCNDRFLQVYDMSFDVFYFSFLVPLSVGASCYVVSNHQKQPRYIEILQMLNRFQITVISMVPVTLLFFEKYLHQLNFPSLRYSFFSGDALYQSVARKWKKCLPNGEIHNFYGPTETTVVCTRYIWGEAEADLESVNNIVPLGKPFPGMQYLIVDDNNIPVKRGETGELAFAGSQVINAYIDNAYPHLFFETVENGKRVQYYKTGDLAFENIQQNLIFKGRKDFQRKISGFRVELEEVEMAISGITQSVSIAIVHTNVQNIAMLYAFCNTHTWTEEAILEKLTNILPVYMIPRRIFIVNTWPLNANQKIDREELLKFVID